MALASPTFASATLPWGADGIPIAVGPAKQRAPECQPDGQGGVLIFWGEPRGEHAHDVFVQRITRAGVRAAGWPATGVSRGNVWGHDYDADIYWNGTGATMAPAGDGGCYLAWRDRRNPPGAGADEGEGDLFLLRFDASGAPAAGWPEDGIALSVGQLWDTDPTLLPDGAGGVFAAWSVLGDNGYLGVRLDHLLPDGTRPAGWIANGVPTTRLDLGYHQDVPVLLPDGTGGLFVGWRAVGGPSPCFGLMRVRADGSLADGWPDVGAAFALGMCGDLRLVDGPGGDVYAVWTETPTIETYVPSRVHALRITSGQGAVRAGWPLDGVVLPSAGYDSYNMRAISDGAGGLYAVWPNWLGDFVFDLRVQRVDTEGNLVFPAAAIATGDPESFVDYVSVVADGSGGVIAGWTTRDLSGNSDVFARRIAADGRRSASADRVGNPVSRAEGNQYVVRLASDGEGGAFEVWVDHRADPDGDIYAQWTPARSIAPAPLPTDPVSLSAPHPNPTRGTTLLELAVPRPSAVEVDVFDVMGARVKTLLRGDLPASTAPIAWDGSDEHGARVRPGVYLLRARVGAAALTRRIVRVE